MESFNRFQPEESITKVYYFPIDGQGNEVGEAVEINIIDGIADISKLPAEEQKTLERFGVPDVLHRDRYFPKDGQKFLDGLLRMTSGYCRYRVK